MRFRDKTIRLIDSLRFHTYLIRRLSESFALSKTRIPLCDLLGISLLIILLALIGVPGNKILPPNFGVFPVSAQEVQQGKWEPGEEMPTPRCFSSSDMVDGRLYVFGGSKGLGAVEETVLEYDSKSETWIELDNMPEARVDPASAEVNGKILVFGGEIGWNIGALDSVLEFDPRTQNWTGKTKMPTSRRWHTAAELNGEVYIIGGETGDRTKTPIVDVYDPITDTWRQAANFPVPTMTFMSACVLNGKLYVVGGSMNGLPGWTGSETPRLYEYDPTLDRWTRLADMSTKRSGLSTFTMDGFIIAVGGDNVNINGDFMLETTEIYDPISDTWTKGPDLPQGRAYFSIEIIEGRAYAAGGMSFWGTPEKSLLVYTPEGWIPPRSVSPEGKLPVKWGKIKQSS